MSNDTIGIDEEALNSMILSIYDCADRINKILNTIDDEFSKISLTMEGDVANTLKKKCESIRTNFPITSKNIVSYSEYLINVKKRYANIGIEMKQKISSDISEITDHDNIEIL